MRKTNRFFAGIMAAALAASMMFGDSCRTIMAATDETTMGETTESGVEEEEENIDWNEVVYSTEGSCGKNATYKYDTSTKTLTITGTGMAEIRKGSDHTKYKSFYDIVSQGIKKVKVGEGITGLGKILFQSCEELEDISLPSTLKSIGEECFFCCEKLMSIKFPKKLKSIGTMAFQAVSLKKVILPDSVTQVDNAAFRYTDIESIRFSKNMKKLSDEVVFYCENLKTVTLPEKLETIGKEAFSYCKSLKKIKLPKKLKTVKEEAFKECRCVKTLTIPKTVKTFEKSALYANHSLRKVVNHSSIKITLSHASKGLSWRVGKRKVKAVGAGKTAKAVPKKLKITYKLHGGKMKGKKTTTYQFGKQKLILPTPKKKGYVFTGWKDKEGNLEQQEVSVDPYFARTLTLPRINYTLHACYAKVSAKASGDDLKVQISTRRELPRDHYYLIEYADNKEMKNVHATYGDDVNVDTERITHSTDGDLDTVSIHGLEKGKTYYLRFRIIYESEPDYDDNKVYDSYFDTKVTTDREYIHSAGVFYKTKVKL